MIPNHRIAGLFYNRPLLLTPTAADTISNFLLTRIGFGGPAMRGGGGGEDDAREAKTYFPAQAGGDGSVVVHSPAASRFVGDIPLSEDGARRPLPFRRTAEGVAIITLVGEWVNRGGYIGASSGVISYEGFKFQLAEVARDPRSKAVILDMESPGGEAVGAFEAAAAVRALAAIKPVWAVVNGLCASAMYAIASGASRIVSIPTGISGSIDVVLAHFDMSEYLKKEGIKPTFIHAGARKVDANPYQALPDSVRDRLQAEITTFYDLFVSTVAAGRTGMTEASIRGTEAGTFMGARALELGLVDALGTLEEVVAELGTDAGTAPRARPAPAVASPSAATPPALPAPAAAAPSIPALAATQHMETDVIDAEAEQIRAAERQRFAAILDASEARGREAQARELAFRTSLTPETAISIMRASPPGDGGFGSDAAAFLASRAADKPLILDPDVPITTGEVAAAEREAAALDHVNSLNASLPKGAIVPGRRP